MNHLEIFQNEIIKYCSSQVNHYDLWIYDGNDIIQVYDNQKPNTIKIWFEFNSFTYLYWRLMQQQCIENINGNNFYNYIKLRKFMLKYMLCGTNLPFVILQRNDNGQLTEESFNSVLKIHPRILRAVFNLVNVFPRQLQKEQEVELQKQCLKLFGKGQSVSNPNKWIVLYCNLIAFWDKLGMNYNDIMNLPNETFIFLKKIMALQNNYRALSLSTNKSSSKGVSF